MTLVDTSLWIDHLRRSDKELRALLIKGEVLCHPFIIGELACGSLAKRTELLNLFAALPQAKIAKHDEAMHFLNENRLYGQGLGWIDLHLLASASLSRVKLWSRDRAPKRAAELLGNGES